MIKQLAKYLANLNNTEIQLLNEDLSNEHQKVLDLLESNALKQQKIDKLENDKKTLLDEIVLNQQRIDALLKQLRDKNGGQ